MDFFFDACFLVDGSFVLYTGFSSFGTVVFLETTCKGGLELCHPHYHYATVRFKMKGQWSVVTLKVVTGFIPLSRSCTLRLSPMLSPFSFTSWVHPLAMQIPPRKRLDTVSMKWASAVFENPAADLFEHSILMQSFTTHESVKAQFQISCRSGNSNLVSMNEQ
ncbi:unnamed protein product [Linum tenue]|uniref:Uncharacterized protein n=1 Tax=Linum tenue TaxID=586396 RepID=A0AAV0GUI4_9ROSI|nr:unnamed protein product [Linum tenue]